MTPIDWKSTLFGFAAACLAVTALALVAPVRDSLLIAALAGATCLASFGLALRAKWPADPSTH